jgi:PPOX class probable F420-dependent enzyme
MSTLPGDHLDLLDRPIPTVLTTEMPDGRLQSTVVWCNRDGDDVLLNTMLTFQKARNLRDRPRATVLVVDPDDDVRWIEVRGAARLEPDGASEHLDELARLYTGASRYFGEVVPEGLSEEEDPIRCRIVPTAVCTGRRRIPGDGRSTVPVPPWWNERRPCDDDVEMPTSHRALLDRPLIASLATRLPGGHAQTQPVWFELDGTDLLVGTTRERQKGRNLEADPRATLLVVDPADSSRWIEVRTDVDLTDIDAEAVLDRLTRRYTTDRHYYGSIYPEAQRGRETRVTARLHPRRVTCDAIHR